MKAIAWAANDSSGIFAPLKFSRRAIGEHDAKFKVLYCGICHSDLHLARNEWGFTIYPLTPGHEITGVVTEVGNKLEKFKPGDKVAVGSLGGSCRECEECTNNEESYCPKQIFSMSALDYDGTVTYGGFSNLMVANEHFVIRWPENFPIDKGTPLLCAGITTYSPLRRFGLDRPGVNVGVVGLGGIGHFTVKFAKALGSRVTVISISISKKKEAMGTFGASEFLLSHDEEQMQAAQGTLDGIRDSVSSNTSPTVSKSVKASRQAHLDKSKLIGFCTTGGKSIVGSVIGGVKETQKMLFAAKQNILTDGEVVPMDYVNTVARKMMSNIVSSLMLGIH